MLHVHNIIFFSVINIKMGCAESTPVVQPHIQPQPQPIVYAYAVPPPNQQSYPKYSEDPVDINRAPPPYNPNLKPVNNAYPMQQYPQYQQTYIQPFPQYYTQPYPPQYQQQYRQQPSMLQTMGAVAGGVIVGDMISDALFD
jgi:hypothetical protein